MANAPAEVQRRLRVQLQLRAEIEGAETVRIVGEDEWSFDFEVEFKNGETTTGVYMKVVHPDLPDWALNDY